MPYDTGTAQLLNQLTNPPNPMDQVGKTIGGINLLQQYRADRASANAYQQSVDPVTGAFDQGKYNALLSQAPGGGWNFGKAMQQSGLGLGAQSQGTSQQVQATLDQQSAIGTYLQPLTTKLIADPKAVVTGQDVSDLLNTIPPGLIPPTRLAQIQQQVQAIGPTGDASNFVRGAAYANSHAIEILKSHMPGYGGINQGSTFIPTQTNPTYPGGSTYPTAPVPLGVSPDTGAQIVPVQVGSNQTQQMPLSQAIPLLQSSPALRALNPNLVPMLSGGTSGGATPPAPGHYPGPAAPAAAPAPPAPAPARGGTLNLPQVPDFSGQMAPAPAPESAVLPRPQSALPAPSPRGVQVASLAPDTMNDASPAAAQLMPGASALFADASGGGASAGNMVPGGAMRAPPSPVTVGPRPGTVPTAPTPAPMPAPTGTPAYLRPPGLPPPEAGGIGLTAQPGYVENIQQPSQKASTALFITANDTPNIAALINDMRSQVNQPGWTPGLGVQAGSAWRQTLQRLGVNANPTGTQAQIDSAEAAYNEFSKDANLIASRQLSTLGNPSDARQGLAEAITPGTAQSKEGVLGISATLLGNQHAINQQSAAWAQAKQQGWSDGRYNEWLNQRWNVTDPATGGRFDPRVFWLADTPGDRADQIRRFAAKIPTDQQAQFLQNVQYAKNQGWIRQNADGSFATVGP